MYGQYLGLYPFIWSAYSWSRQVLSGPFIVKDLCKSNYRPQIILPLTSPLKIYFVTRRTVCGKTVGPFAFYSGNLIVYFVSVSNRKIAVQVKEYCYIPTK